VKPGMKEWWWLKDLRSLQFSLNHSELNSIHPETKEATHIINSGLLPIKKVTFMGEIQGWEGS
jgi:hypothetical protein